MRGTPGAAARQRESALELGDWEADAFNQAPLSLRFRHGPLEERYRSYRARRARELGATPWVTRLGMLVARVCADVIDGLARNRSWHRYELLATGLFGICVVALYFASRHIKIASGDGSYERWVAAVLGLAVLQAVQVVLAFSFFGDEWSRPYYLGLDVAVDAGLFALCFGLHLVAVAGALACDFVALGVGLGTTPHARIYPLLSAAVLVIAFLVVARAADRRARQHYVESLRFDAKQSRDMRGISNPFSTVNLAAWLFPSGSRTLEDAPSNRPSADATSPGFNFQGSKNSLAAMAQTMRRASDKTPFDPTPPAPVVVGEEKKGSEESLKPPPAALKRARRFATLQSWQIDYERLRVVAKIGAGAAGQVYTGEFMGARVAIKQLFSSFIDPSNLDEFSREVTLLHKLKHPHVLTFYGISRRDVYCFIVTEYCPYALDAILSGGRVADDVLRGANGKPRQTPRLTVAARTTILYQVALALQYLHAERVLHHDLKPGNILLDRDFTAKVSDFGLAQLVADADVDVVGGEKTTKAPRRMSAGATAVYAAPEMLLKLRGRFKDRPHGQENSSDGSRDMSDSGRVVAGNFDELSKLDVFAYAIVCAAVFSQRGDPYHFYVTNARSPQAREADIADAVRDQGLRPQVPAALPEELRPLMERCWATDPGKRPAFREIAKRLKAVAVRHGTIVPTTSSKLPLGPEARGSESSAHSSFSDEREDPRAKPPNPRRSLLYN